MSGRYGDGAGKAAVMTARLGRVLRTRNAMASWLAVPARPPSTGYIGVYFRYDRAAEEPSWFWVNQFVPGSIVLPEGIGIPELETDLAAVQLWTLGEPRADEQGPSTRFQFIAKTAKYDRVISFEGAERPDMQQARRVVESMLRQE